MFFDLTARVSPDNLPPPPPVTVTTHLPATFTQDFSVSCDHGQHPFWREFAFNTASPEVMSASLLRITITLNPTPDLLHAPTLLHWRIQYDCVFDE